MTKIEEIEKLIKTQNLIVSGAGIGEQGYVASKLSSPVIFVASNSENAYKISLQLEALDVKNCLIDSFDLPFVFSKFQSGENKIKLINALFKLCDEDAQVIVTTIEGLNLNLSSKKSFKDSILNLKQGGEYNFLTLSGTLINMGYTRVESVDSMGEFSLRGDIVDIFPPNHEYPIRINFFDDEIESIIYFDSDNLSKIKDLEEVKIAPFSTVILKETEKSEISRKIDEMMKIYRDETLSELRNKADLSPEFLPLFDVETHSILEYLDDPILILQNKLNLETYNEKYFQKIFDQLNLSIKNDELREKLLEIVLKNKEKIDDILNLKSKKSNCLIFDNIFDENTKNIDLKSRNLNDYSKNIELIKTDLPASVLKEKKVILCLDNEPTLNSIKEILTHLSIPYSTGDGGRGIILSTKKIPFNICVSDEDVWLVGSKNFAHKKEIEKTSTKKIKFLPKANEYVVHEVHGIGLCDGIVTLKVMGVDKDFFKIEYLHGDVLYVPTENTDSLSLYMGSESVKLNKLGGKEFGAIKKRTEKAIEEMAKELLELYAERKRAKGYKYSPDNYLMTEFENSFNHTETVDQAQAIEDVKNDMMSGKVMDRLICGDVGYGKTEVAIRACFKTFLDGKQTAILTPTTILSLQHYMNFKERFKDFGVRVEMLNRFKSQKEKAEIINKLKSGEIDVVSGTHALLTENIGFKDLGLLVLDEEQRFGVKAKEKLKTIKKNVNVLTMSATPIPRTLNMSMLNLRDISIINTPPMERLPIKTYVCAFNYEVCAQAIKNEIERGGQVLVVYNNIDNIYSLASQFKSLLQGEEYKFDVAHGRMTRLQLENAIKRLYERETNIFISTTLIENGIDLPKANTLIVVDSQNLGLSQMYQLRGRVGRSSEQAYAYFTYPKDKTMTVEASDRLETIAENTDLGSGFKIALRDMQLRGAGELLGKEQHGHMVQVGYDMYVQLLNETVKRLKGEKVEINREVKIDIAINARIPNNFVSDETEKLKIYSKISNIYDIASEKRVLEELKESFGKLPKEIIQLINVALIKALAQKLNIKHIVLDKNNYSVTFYKEGFNLDELLKRLNNFPKFSLINAELPTIKLKSNEFSPETAQGYLIGFLTSQIS